MAMRHPAPLFFLLTLLIVIETRNSQFSQHVSATLSLSIYSYHIPTVTKSGGMNGGMRWPLDPKVSGHEKKVV